MALFTRTAKLDPGAHDARCAGAIAVHQAVGISCQRNSGYRPSRVNIMAQGLSTPDPSLTPTHLSIRRGRATTTHYTHHQVSLMVSRNTTLVPSLGLHTGPACEAGLSAGMRRERVTPTKKERKKKTTVPTSSKTMPIRYRDVFTCRLGSSLGLVTAIVFGRWSTWVEQIRLKTTHSHSLWRIVIGRLFYFISVCQQHYEQTIATVVTKLPENTSEIVAGSSRRCSLGQTGPPNADRRERLLGRAT